jgi:hypothetical protein
MAVTKETLSKEYKIFKGEAFRSLEAGDFQNSLLHIDLCARIAYTFNFIYIDDELEDLLAHISSQLLTQPEFKPEKRFVFYDYFGFDNQGLTKQYIRAMMNWGVEFLYILEIGDNLSSSKDILTELASYSKAEVLILKGNRLDKITQAYNAIAQYKPEKAFLHFAPWDVIGVCVWSQFKNVQRFFINLTDHAFWLGKSCSDYIIEFRPFGHNLSVKARGISPDILFIQPYYPIQSESKFLGFNVDVSNKIIGFSGAALHKIYGRGGKFLNLIKKALADNENFIFLMAGAGYSKPILDFIKANRLEDRFILLGHRKDINQVIKNIDIFINTYPISGGLMTQLAVLNNKALISYSSPDLSVNFVEDFLNVDREKVFSIKEEESFSTEINKLISDRKFRDENAALYRNSIPTVEEFNSGLNKIVLEPEKYNHMEVHDIPIDLEADQSVYIEIENSFYKHYDFLKLKYLGVKYFKLSPVAALKSIISSSFYNFELYKKILKGIFR